MTQIEEGIRRNCDWESTSPWRALVEALADLEKVDPKELDVVLYDYVDPNALDELIARSKRSDVLLTFDIEDYHVEIDGETLTVERID